MGGGVWDRGSLHNRKLNPCIKYSFLTASMADAAGEATPPFSCNIRKCRPTDAIPPRKLPLTCPWWNTECNKLIKMRKAALWQFQYTAQDITLSITRTQKPKLEMG
jgi:hypothetical protein